MLAFLPEPLRTVIAFLVVLGVVVFVHELGHYLAAVWRGVFVEVFSIGFGRPITAWRDRRGTIWAIGWLPLGGYVKLHGSERPEDASEFARARWRPGRTLHGKSVGTRAIILAAGPVANFVLAAVLFIGLSLVLGQAHSTTTIADVRSGSAADRGGLKAGDVIVSMGGNPVTSFEDVKRIIDAYPEKPLPTVVERDGERLDLAPTPDAVMDGGKMVGLLGIMDREKFERVGVGQAIAIGAAETWTTIMQTLGGIWEMISGQRGASELGGVIGIATLSGQVAGLGFSTFLTFIALLSVNLGLLNLFPIPVLDGGQLLFCAAEAVRGRPLPPRAVDYGFRAGLALIVSLMVFAAVNDLSRLGLFRWVGGLIG